MAWHGWRFLLVIMIVGSLLVDTNLVDVGRVVELLSRGACELRSRASILMEEAGTVRPSSAWRLECESMDSPAIYPFLPHQKLKLFNGYPWWISVPILVKR